MDVNIYRPNPALAEIMVSQQMRDIVSERIQLAQLLYQAIVAKRSGALARSAHAHTSIETVLKGEPRWVGTLTVGGDFVDYALPHEFGRGEHPGSLEATGFGDSQIVQRPADDLNRVLEELGGL